MCAKAHGQEQTQFMYRAWESGMWVVSIRKEKETGRPHRALQTFLKQGDTQMPEWLVGRKQREQTQYVEGAPYLPDSAFFGRHPKDMCALSRLE